MICPECGSYQPDRAKYCGICGAGLSQEGLVERFLKDRLEHDIDIPRHRGFVFYTILVLVVIVALAALAGAGYIVYRVAWSSDKPAGEDREPEDTTRVYKDVELGFSITYPERWVLESGTPTEGELTFLTLSLTARKNMEIRAFQLDPLISIGGIEAIEEHLAEDAVERIVALGGHPESSREQLSPSVEPALPGEDDASASPEGTQTTPESPGEETPPSTTGGEDASGQEQADDWALRSTRISGLPAFYVEFTANYMGEETGFILYYIVAGDSVFLFQGRAPAGEYQAVRPQFYSITTSFKWEEAPGGQGLDDTAI